MMSTCEEQATGCQNAHSYKTFARQQSFRHCEVLNWSSSAGDWQFLVTKNKRRGPWFVLYQENNYPYAGFSHSIGKRPYYGTLRQVYQQIEAEW